MSGLDRENVAVRKLAIAATLASLLPLGMGSLVTTLGAGMAFPDWPTSDGQGMLSYPWHLAAGHQFVEHGHRLAGVMIGLFSIALCVVAWAARSTKPVRVVCTIALAGVIVQGILGGMRVLMDERMLAYGHSVFGCLVFVSLCTVILMTNKDRLEFRFNCPSDSSIRFLAYLFPAITFSQYILGGSLRHLGSGLHLHLGGAVVTLFITSAVVRASNRTEAPGVRKMAQIAKATVLLQVLLGVFTWMTKYGFPQLGYVAVQHSTSQIVIRTVHTIAGMAVVASSVAWSFTAIKATAMQSGRVAVR